MIDEKRLYTARQIREENLLYWLTAYKSVLRYVKNPKYRTILKPRTLGAASGTRYYILGSDLKKFIKKFEDDRLGDATPKPVARETVRVADFKKGEWISVLKACNAGLIPGVKTYSTFHRHLAEGKLRDLEVKIVASADGTKRYKINVKSLSKLPK